MVKREYATGMISLAVSHKDRKQDRELQLRGGGYGRVFITLGHVLFVPTGATLIVPKGGKTYIYQYILQLQVDFEVDDVLRVLYQMGLMMMLTRLLPMRINHEPPTTKVNLK